MSLRRIQRLLFSSCPAALAFLLTACGGAGGGKAFVQPDAGTVRISGKVTYDFVPHAASGGLDYGQTQPRPARLVTVQFVPASGAPVTTRTDLNGEYALDVPASKTGMIRVLAQSLQTGAPGWAFSVVDNTQGNAIYTLDGAPASSGTDDSTRNLHAGSGWTGMGYGDTRAAAPFAILDSIYLAAAYIVAADPAIVFPELRVHWSPQNIGSFDADGNPNPVTGEVGTSFYAVLNRPGQPAVNGIYLLGEENQDSDEYDPHVIVHEFGHYLDHRFGRSKSIGGPHADGDLLDPRVAFSEGWPTALAGLVLANPMYADAGFSQQQSAYGFSIERQPIVFPNHAPGWYSERSVWELVYDLVDTGVDGGETLAYPFAHVWNVLKGAMTTTPALPTIFPFWNAIRIAHPGDTPQLDMLTSAQSIDPITDDYGANETNDAGSAHVLPIYTPVAVNGPSVNLCSTDEFTNPPVTGTAVNNLGSRRFLRFSSALQGTVTVTVSATSIPDGEYADPDFGFHSGPLWLTYGSAPTDTCKANATGSGTPESCVETATIPVTLADYVLEVYEWTNTNDTDDPEFPPIGETCFDVSVQQP